MKHTIKTAEIIFAALLWTIALVMPNEHKKAIREPEAELVVKEIIIFDERGTMASEQETSEEEIPTSEEISYDLVAQREDESEVCSQTETYRERSASEMGSVDGGTDSWCTTGYFSINGEICPYSEYLYQSLVWRGIEWWYPYALCQMYQESHFNPNAVCNHADGTNDCGIYQYKDRYWTGEYGYIFDPIAQINKYCDTVCQKIYAGLSTEQIISDHFTGGYGFNQVYVNDVMKWLGVCYRIN